MGTIVILTADKKYYLYNVGNVFRAENAFLSVLNENKTSEQDEEKN